MQTQYLNSFCAIVEMGSFSRAAKKMRCSQAAISKQIHTLEEELGCELFYRNGKRISLNPNGEIVYRQSQRMLQVAEDMRREIFRSVRGEGVMLRLGTTDEIGLGALPGWLKNFKEAHADCFVSMVIDSAAYILRLLKERQLRLAVLPEQIDDADGNLVRQACGSACGETQFCLMRNCDAELSECERELWEFLTAKA